MRILITLLAFWSFSAFADMTHGQLHSAVNARPIAKGKIFGLRNGQLNAEFGKANEVTVTVILNFDDPEKTPLDDIMQMEGVDVIHHFELVPKYELRITRRQAILDILRMPEVTEYRDEAIMHDSFKFYPMTLDAFDAMGMDGDTVYYTPTGKAKNTTVVISDTGAFGDMGAFERNGASCPSGGSSDSNCRLKASFDLATNDNAYDCSRQTQYCGSTNEFELHGSRTAAGVARIHGANIVMIDVQEPNTASLSMTAIEKAIEWTIGHMNDDHIYPGGLRTFVMAFGSTNWFAGECTGTGIDLHLEALTAAGIFSPGASGNESKRGKISAPACHKDIAAVTSSWNRTQGSQFSGCGNTESPNIAKLNYFGNLSSEVKLAAPGCLLTSPEFMGSPGSRWYVGTSQSVAWVAGQWAAALEAGCPPVYAEECLTEGMPTASRSTYTTARIWEPQLYINAVKYRDLYAAENAPDDLPGEGTTAMAVLEAKFEEAMVQGVTVPIITSTGATNANIVTTSSHFMRNGRECLKDDAAMLALWNERWGSTYLPGVSVSDIVNATVNSW